MTGCGDSRQILFKGRDLIGWSAFPADKTSIWSAKNGKILCQGKPNGYLRTEKEYGNYHFHCEWRWPDRPGEGGVILHTAGQDRLWPNGIKIQLKSPDTGDLYLTGPNLAVSKLDLTIRTVDDSVVRIPKQLADSENPPGQWNSLDVFCGNNTIRVFVNGFMQNEVVQASRNRGSLCLLSEGTPIEFQNLYLNSLK
jgi:hypothetical protein